MAEDTQTAVAVTPPTKPWYKSRTIWFNVIVAILIALETALHIVQPFIPGNIYAWSLLLLIIVNAGLRIITSQGLTL